LTEALRRIAEFKMERVEHILQPVYDKNSRVLILGSIPSPKSRENGFYYGHPQNRMWTVLSQVCGENKPETNEEKKAFLLRNNIAMWDVLAECEIDGAKDSSIKKPVPNDINMILRESKVKNIYTTGKIAWNLYEKLCYPATGLHAYNLPSTSPANCAYSLERLVKEYIKILG